MNKVTPYITHRHNVHLDEDYAQWISELKSRYRRAQIKAAMKVNAEKLLWNWQIGRDLVLRKAESRWGSGIVEQISLDLQAEFPYERGFGSANLWSMKRWYIFYSNINREKLEHLVQEIQHAVTSIRPKYNGRLKQFTIQWA